MGRFTHPTHHSHIIMYFMISHHMWRLCIICAFVYDATCQDTLEPQAWSRFLEDTQRLVHYGEVIWLQDGA